MCIIIISNVIIIIVDVKLILCIVSGATMEGVFQSGFWCHEMEAGVDGKISRSALDHVVAASCSRFACVTIPSKLLFSFVIYACINFTKITNVTKSIC